MNPISIFMVANSIQNSDLGILQFDYEGGRLIGISFRHANCEYRHSII